MAQESRQPNYKQAWYYETLFTHIVINKRAVIFPKVCFLAASNERGQAPAESQVREFLLKDNTSKLQTSFFDKPNTWFSRRIEFFSLGE